MIKHLKSRSYYENLYDEMTINDCRLTEKRIKDSTAKKIGERLVGSTRFPYGGGLGGDGFKGDGGRDGSWC
jgi:hypothetical protein